jgi:hypothetical protein
MTSSSEETFLRSVTGQEPEGSVSELKGSSSVGLPLSALQFTEQWLNNKQQVRRQRQPSRNNVERRDEKKIEILLEKKISRYRIIKNLNLNLLAIPIRNLTH